MGRVRAVWILGALAAVTLVGLPVQWAALRVSRPAARRIPVLYHRILLRLLGTRLTIVGRPAPGRPLLLVANHVSWFDIPLLSAIGPLSFVAKSEVGTWPVVKTLARLQRTVFVDRQRRSATGGTREEIAGRLSDGDVMVLFAEGTSNDGNRVLAFKTALFGAVPDGRAEDERPLLVQPVSIAYTRVNGVAMGRQHRPLVAWHGDKDLAPHVLELLRTGPLDAVVVFGEPIPLKEGRGRKEVARLAEETVRAAAMRALHAGEGLLAPLSERRQNR
ncbi:lysophospholipid acyltransferase family protein [Lutibaculum baratangense]|uniref:1-acyl-sn-glycerol-3-phosphate acyltransferase n=1 Tax=Lutibaculum baratangense AMV1 TaxID=631454 RepID=V4RRY4_9HYPH|nr:lysophospholipid acyltransferase family protein [Lutibaculum baratangense]ESR25880.1 1-acyl-sn-glycerol-3-phosphate acyltransferase [Lutibaculum baratangense AMV1]